jgi:hypothetical protein
VYVVVVDGCCGVGFQAMYVCDIVFCRGLAKRVCTYIFLVYLDVICLLWEVLEFFVGIKGMMGVSLIVYVDYGCEG